MLGEFCFIRRSVRLIGRAPKFFSTKTKPTKCRLIINSEKKQAKHFVDFKRIRVIGGRGGNGCMSFLSLYQNEYAGPDGGDGGNGGHIIFKADSNIKSLSRIYPVYKGEQGGKGQHKQCHGKNAEATLIKVPVGTFFRNENSDVVADLRRADDMFVAARGGAGGKGNYFFLSNDNRAPTTYEEGGFGDENILYAELRIIAHIGLVGFPNAGKSSLLRCLTRATPKVGAYPFTTLYPHLGVIEYDDYEQVTIADIPGLIEGAHMNKGLGFSFLRHVEQCKSLIYILDLSYENPNSQLQILKNELEKYKPGLSEKPHIIVGNKIDLPMSNDNFENLLSNLKDYKYKIFPISARKKINIDKLIASIRHLYDNCSNV